MKSNPLISGFSTVYHWSNQEPIKERIKFAVGLPTFLFGFGGIVNASQYFYHGYWKGDKFDNRPNGLTYKDYLIASVDSLSLILSGMVSPPGRKLCDWVFCNREPVESLNRLFGANLPFTAWHLLHIIKFVAFGCGVMAMNIHRVGVCRKDYCYVKIGLIWNTLHHMLKT